MARLAVIESKLDDKRADSEKIRKLEHWRASMTAAVALFAFEVHVGLILLAKHI